MSTIKNTVLIPDFRALYFYRPLKLAVAAGFKAICILVSPCTMLFAHCIKCDTQKCFYLCITIFTKHFF